MPNNPEAWNRLRARVQSSTASLSTTELQNRTAQLQRRWRDHKRSATWNVLQELYTEQHRHQWA